GTAEPGRLASDKRKKADAEGRYFWLVGLDRNRAVEKALRTGPERTLHAGFFSGMEELPGERDGKASGGRGCRENPDRERARVHDRKLPGCRRVDARVEDEIFRFERQPF